VATGGLTDLGHIDYKKSRKRIFCFAGPAPAGAEPQVASWEVDQAEFLPLEEARRLIHPDQAEFLDRLLAMLGGGE
jgi:predicted NUDIX family NTP pyrophosphohydrolase